MPKTQRPTIKPICQAFWGDLELH